MSLSIIIPTWNNAELTCACLASLASNTASDFEIIWVDNGSTAEQYSKVANALSPFEHVAERHPKPLGFAKAVNLGFPHARNDYCVILNNDLTVNPKWDEDLILAVDDQPGLAGPICINSIGWQNSRLHSWLGLPDSITEDDVKCADWLLNEWATKVIDIPQTPTLANFRNMLAFFCVLMPNSVRQSIGLLDENFGWGYCEDDDYCHRARLSGYALTLCPGSSVVHKVGQTLAQLNEDPQSRLTANQQYLAAKWAERAAP